MKIAPFKVKGFLEKPDTLGGVLIYGSDNSRVDFYVKQVVANLAKHSVQVMDFALVNKSPDLLLSELTNLSMFSDRKLIKLVNVQGNISKELKNVLDNNIGHHYIMMIANELPYGSATKNYMESSKLFAVVVCYKDNNSDLYDIISNHLKQNDIKYTSESINHLQYYFNHSRASLCSELEKLILYLGKRKDLKLSDIESCFATSGSNYATLDDLCFTIANKDISNFIRVSDILISHENFSPIALTRIVSNYFLRLQNVLLSQQSGMSEQEAINQLNPPLFFKQLQNFKFHLKKLHSLKLKNILKDLMNLEVMCKKTDLNHKMLFQHKISQMLVM